MSLLGIDVGTTACKVAAFASDGRPLAAAVRGYPLRTPGPGRAELDPDHVWAAVADAVAEVNDAVADAPVTALAVSAQGEAAVAVDADGRALAPSPVSADARAAAECERLVARVGGARLAEITGQPPHPMHTLPKLMWWGAHEPDVVARSRMFACYDAFVGMRLGAPPTTDFSMAARTLAFDIRRLAWSDEVLAAAGVDPGRLPPVVPAGTPIGEVDAETAARLGFRGRPLVVAGGHDQPCGALGVGAAGPGRAAFAIGTTACVTPVLDEPNARLLAAGYPCYPHVVDGAFVTLAGTQNGGAVLRWFRDVLGDEERRAAAATGASAYDLLVAAASPEPSPVLVLPHLAGSGAPENAPGSLGAVVGLTLATTRAEIVRAVLEGVMLEMAVNLAELDACGVAVRELVAVGGGARSDRWLQIAGDVLGLPVVRSEHAYAACWGAAWLAARGSGVQVAARSADGPRFVPDRATADHYAARLDTYRHLHDALRATNRALRGDG